MSRFSIGDFAIADAHPDSENLFLPVNIPHKVCDVVNAHQIILEGDDTLHNAAMFRKVYARERISMVTLLYKNETYVKVSLSEVKRGQEIKLGGPASPIQVVCGVYNGRTWLANVKGYSYVC